MSKSTLLAAAILKDDLAGEDKINATLFSVAFGELDDLRKSLAQIPLDIDSSATRFQKITTQSVDDFVTVANEALSKFMQRTKEISAKLDDIERASQVIGTSATQTPIVAVVAPKIEEKHKPAINSLWFIVPCLVFVGAIIGLGIAALAFK
jgi:hypothetical protein